MLENFEGLLAKKRELEALTKSLDQYAVDLLEKKRQLLDEIEKWTNEKIAPLKEEISQIDSEVEKIIRSTGVDRLVSDSYGAYLKDERSVRITDMARALRWVESHPQVLKKDILKVSELDKLINEGIVPDPQEDGVECNDTYTKVTYRRR